MESNFTHAYKTNRTYRDYTVKRAFSEAKSHRSIILDIAGSLAAVAIITLIANIVL